MDQEKREEEEAEGTEGGDDWPARGRRRFFGSRTAAPVLPCVSKKKTDPGTCGSRAEG